jgi:alpha-1,2-rhamnosyltransferase
MIRPTITIDASHTYGSGKNTGIERVVRNLCRELPGVLEQRGYPQLQIATHFQGRFLQIDPGLEKSLQFLARWERNAGEFVPGWVQAFPKWIAGASGSTKLRKWMEPRPSHLGIYKLPHHMARWSSLTRKVFEGNSLESTADRVLILPDAYWTRRDIWKTVQAHRKAGTLIATVVYDLIPLTHPEYVGKKRSEKFQGYLDEVVRNSDTIIAISKTVRDDVQRYIDAQANRTALCQDVRAFVLGAELGVPASDTTGQSIRSVVKALFNASSANPPYLMVASFDPRKNHAQALDAFDLLWKSHPELQICFVGRSGSSCDGFMRRIDQHPKLNRGLWVFHDLTDLELHHVYEHCSGVLLPSIVEGFGLPIVESLWHGRKTFASDTPIHREVGGRSCEYFPLHDPLGLSKQIEAWELLRAAGSTQGCIKGSVDWSKPTTWRQSATQLLDAVLDAYAQRLSVPQKRAA